MIDDLLPDVVAAVETTVDAASDTLFPGEEALIANAVAKRRNEFITARHCARQAMSALGVPPTSIPRGEHREPLWPDGVVGSLTHTDSYRAAAVALASEVASLGVDAEPHGPLPDGVLDTVSLPSERAWIAERGASGTHWDRLLFCAKEAVYKTWFPITGRWLGFEDAEIRFDDAGTFTADVLVSPAVVDGHTVTRFTGRWSARNGFALTAITLAPNGAALLP